MLSRAGWISTATEGITTIAIKIIQAIPRTATMAETSVTEPIPGLNMRTTITTIIILQLTNLLLQTVAVVTIHLLLQGEAVAVVAVENQDLKDPADNTFYEKNHTIHRIHALCISLCAGS